MRIFIYENIYTLLKYVYLELEKEGGLIAGIKYRDRNGPVSHAGW